LGWNLAAEYHVRNTKRIYPVCYMEIHSSFTLPLLFFNVFMRECTAVSANNLRMQPYMSECSLN